jgi:hypothetical protein
MKNTQQILRTALVAGASIAALGLSGCAVHRLTSKAEPTSFYHSTGAPESATISRLPFERAWKSPTLDGSRYSKIAFRPVTTAYLRSDMWQQSASPFITNEAEFDQQASELAHYWNKSLHAAFNTPKNRLAVTHDSAQPGTLVVEIAITEVVFGRPAANAASYAVPVGGVAFSATLNPAVAFEARVRDGATGQLLAVVSDRRNTKIKLLDISKFTYTKSNQQICDAWSKEIMESFNADLFPKVNRSRFGVF